MIDEQVSILKIHKHYIDQFIGPFTKYVLCPNITPFYSLTSHNDEISLIIDSNYVKYFENISHINIINNYKIIKIYNDVHGIDEVGIVCDIFASFVDKHIPILYINSHSNNYILFEIKDLLKVEETIHKLFE